MPFLLLKILVSNTINILTNLLYAAIYIVFKLLTMKLCEVSDFFAITFTFRIYPIKEVERTLANS